MTPETLERLARQAGGSPPNYCRNFWEFLPPDLARFAALVRAAQLDCRTCRHHTTASGGCVSVLRCVDGAAYQQSSPRQLWRTGQ